MAAQETRGATTSTQRYLLTGVLTVIPLWITWLVFTFFLNQLSRFGAPWVRGFAGALDPYAPGLARWLVEPWFEYILAALVTLVALYLLGWLTTRVLGRRLLDAMDSLIQRIPLIQRIYGATKRLMDSFQQRPEEVQRVALIPFPQPELQVICFVTKTFVDEASGKRYAACYVPTTPNPTSGYLEIVPIDKVYSIDWTVDEAISFIISAGTLTPDRIHFGSPSGEV